MKATSALEIQVQVVSSKIASVYSIDVHAVSGMMLTVRFTARVLSGGDRHVSTGFQGRVDGRDTVGMRALMPRTPE